MTTVEAMARASAERRAQVAELLRQGWTLAAIAARLGVTPNTVWRDKRRLAQGSTTPIESWAKALTERKTAVAKLCLEGWTVDDVAVRLGVSTRTVERDREELGLAKPHSPFTPEERLRVQTMLDDGCSIAEVARTIGRNESYLSHLYRGQGWTSGRETGELLKLWNRRVELELDG